MSIKLDIYDVNFKLTVDLPVILLTSFGSPDIMSKYY